MEPRKATLERKTRETEISLSIDLDGQGISQVSTGNGMLDHLIASSAATA